MELFFLIVVIFTFFGGAFFSIRAKRSLNKMFKKIAEEFEIQTREIFNYPKD